MSALPVMPTTEGWHGYRDRHGNPCEVEVYEYPGVGLCVWADDMGNANYDQMFTVGDEIYGHIPIGCCDVADWTGYLRPLGD